MRLVYNIKKLGIKQILTIASDIPEHTQPDFTYLHIKIEDSNNENITKYFIETYHFINSAPTLVHCKAGISRSSTIVISYLMRNQKIHFRKAYDIVKKARCIIEPNLNFTKQLQKYERVLKVMKIVQ